MGWWLLIAGCAVVGAVVAAVQALDRRTVRHQAEVDMPTLITNLGRLGNPVDRDAVVVPDVAATVSVSVSVAVSPEPVGAAPVVPEPVVPEPVVPEPVVPEPVPHTRREGRRQTTCTPSVRPACRPTSWQQVIRLR
jgi:hypothetical protein